VLNQLYAAIQEWSTGQHKAVEFSANSYLDVYLGNVNTFCHIREKRPEAFHVMMHDIYLQARWECLWAVMTSANLLLQYVDSWRARGRDCPYWAWWYWSVITSCRVQHPDHISKSIVSATCLFYCMRLTVFNTVNNRLLLHKSLSCRVSFCFEQ